MMSCVNCWYLIVVIFHPTYIRVRESTHLKNARTHLWPNKQSNVEDCSDRLEHEHEQSGSIEPNLHPRCFGIDWVKRLISVIVTYPELSSSKDSMILGSHLMSINWSVHSSAIAWFTADSPRLTILWALSWKWSRRVVTKRNARTFRDQFYVWFEMHRMKSSHNESLTISFQIILNSYECIIKLGVTNLNP